jgi:23S rRNA (cytidine1920-2'-O)/16S rRNA (cytidine1409-2'-O)-methyltransferase
MRRLDQEMVERGLAESREKAKRAILAGEVRINEQRAHKPSDTVKTGDRITLDAPEKYVSRGGLKLEHALNHFRVDVSGLIVIDLGASTGGFTDCVLQRGAQKVYAVDVGHGQLAWKLRRDDRVAVMEKTNARTLSPREFPPPFSPADLVVIDCSFISLRKIIPSAVALLKPGGKIVALIKPQFEAGKKEADRGRGVIRDSAVHDRVLAELKEFVRGFGFGAQAPKQTPHPGPLPFGRGEGESSAAGGAGRSSVTQSAKLRWSGVVESPILGPAGNKEFLALIEKS